MHQKKLGEDLLFFLVLAPQILEIFGNGCSSNLAKIAMFMSDKVRWNCQTTMVGRQNRPRLKRKILYKTFSLGVGSWNLLGSGSGKLRTLNPDQTQRFSQCRATSKEIGKHEPISVSSIFHLCGNIPLTYYIYIIYIYRCRYYID